MCTCKAVFVSSASLGTMATSGCCMSRRLVPACSGRKVEEVGLRRLGSVDEYTCATSVGCCQTRDDEGPQAGRIREAWWADTRCVPVGSGGRTADIYSLTVLEAGRPRSRCCGLLLGPLSLACRRAVLMFPCHSSSSVSVY